MGTFQPPESWGFSRTAAFMAGLAACAVVARLPFQFNVGVDEAFYLVVARQWLEGMPPYAYSFDVKPPLLFALMAGAETVFGTSLLAAKGLAMASVVATACALYLFGRRFVGELAGVVAALFYISSSLTLGGTFSPAELIMAPFTAFGMLLGFSAASAPGRPALRRLLAAGVCLGAAASVKQTAVFEVLPLAAFLLLRRPQKESLKALTAFAAGLLIVPAGFTLFFLAEGHFDALFADVVVAAAARVNVAPVVFGDVLIGLSIGMMLVLPVIILATAACVFRGENATPALWFLTAWAAGALAGVLATRAALVIYFLPLLPPLCLMAGTFTQRFADRLPGRKRLAIAIVVVGGVAVYSACFTAPLFLAGRENRAAASEAAAEMRSAGLKSGDRILVADRDLLVYLVSGADPASRIFHPFHLLCGFPLPAAGTALADTLESRPAFIVAANPLYIRPCEKPELRSLLNGALSRDYCQVGRFGSTVTGGEAGSLLVFGLKDRAGVRCL